MELSIPRRQLSSSAKWKVCTFEWKTLTLLGNLTCTPKSNPKHLQSVNSNFYIMFSLR